MSSKEYILSKMKDLHNTFMSFTFKYEFDKLDESHVIEYSPFDLTDGNLDLDKAIDELYDDYMGLDYAETLVVIDEKDCIGVSNPEIIYRGLRFFDLIEDNIRVSKSYELKADHSPINNEVPNFALAA